MIEVFSGKINQLKNDELFMAETSRVDRLKYYEKTLERIKSVKQWADNEDYKQLARVDVTLS